MSNVRAKSDREFTVGGLESRIRDFINHPRTQHELLQDSASWQQICSSLDAIGDTELAIGAYESAEWPDDDGLKYIFTYGLLQALFVQQDAVQNLCEALDIPYTRSDELWKIRSTRNTSVGHPSKTTREKGPNSWNFISRATMTKSGYTLMSTFADRDPYKFKEVSIADLISTQNEQLAEALESVAKKLEDDAMTHKEQFRQDKLEDIFSRSLSYFIGKIFEGIYSQDYRQVGEIHLKSVINIVKSFRMKLTEREVLPAYDHVEHVLVETEYPLEELTKYFSKPLESKLDDRDAEIFASYVSGKMKELQKIAAEIDNDYAGD